MYCKVQEDVRAFHSRNFSSEYTNLEDVSIKRSMKKLPTSSTIRNLERMKSVAVSSPRTALWITGVGD
jgi:hypothetical protein